MFRYTKILGKAKTVCAILRLKWPLYFNENEVKKSAPIICRQKLFLHFEIKFKIFRATGIRKMFRTKSSALMSKWSITSQLSKMISSNLYHILVILTFLFAAIFIKFGFTISKIGFCGEGFPLKILSFTKRSVWKTYRINSEWKKK